MPITTLDAISLKSPLTQSDWQRYFHLRWELLRKPWHQPIGSERDEFDSLHFKKKNRQCTKIFHIMAISNSDDLIGVGRIHSLEHNLAQIRFMAVIKRKQRQKTGSLILAALESQARDWGINEITLNARNDFIGFYTQMNYQPTGQGEPLFNRIEHTQMKKIVDIKGLV